jgi:hypothetical protein
VLRQIFGSKRNEVTGELSRLHKEELHNLYSSSYTIRLIRRKRMFWTGHVTHIGYRIGAYSVWCVCGIEVKRTLGRPRRSSEDKVKMHLQEVGWRHELDSSGSRKGQVAGACVCGDEHSGSIKCGEYFD